MTPEQQIDNLFDEISEIKSIITPVSFHVEHIRESVDDLKESDLSQWRQIEAHSERIAAHEETISIMRKTGLIIMGALFTTLFTSTVAALGWLIQRMF